jgi:hypothetical protein
MSNERQIGWQVYVCGKEWDIYSYTVVGCQGEKDALAIIKSFVCTGNLKLRTVVTEVEVSSLLPPSAPSQG